MSLLAETPGTSKGSMGVRARGLLLAVSLAALTAGLGVWLKPAAATSPEPGGEGGPGQILYLTYCQSCHGIAGRGDGPAAAALRVRPPDLTRLWERYGTPLDRERLVQYIDGRWLVGAHGPREMPVWGSEFFEDAPPTPPDLESVKRHLIGVLVGYLETLQSERKS